MNLYNKEVLTLLRIGLEDEKDLPVPALAESSFIADTARVVASTGGEARESAAEASNGSINPNSRGGQFISPIPTNRGPFLLALPSTGTNP